MKRDRGPSLGNRRRARTERERHKAKEKERKPVVYRQRITVGEYEWDRRMSGGEIERAQTENRKQLRSGDLLAFVFEWSLK